MFQVRRHIWFNSFSVFFVNSWRCASNDFERIWMAISLVRYSLFSFAYFRPLCEKKTEMAARHTRKHFRSFTWTFFSSSVIVDMIFFPPLFSFMNYNWPRSRRAASELERKHTMACIALQIKCVNKEINARADRSAALGSVGIGTRSAGRLLHERLACVWPGKMRPLRSWRRKSANVRVAFSDQNVHWDISVRREGEQHELRKMLRCENEQRQEPELGQRSESLGTGSLSWENANFGVMKCIPKCAASTGRHVD